MDQCGKTLFPRMSLVVLNFFKLLWNRFILFKFQLMKWKKTNSQILNIDAHTVISIWGSYGQSGVSLKKTGEDGYLPFSYQSVEDENRMKCISCAKLTAVLLSSHFTSFESCWCKTHTLLHHHTLSAYSVQFQFSQLLYTSLDYFIVLL